MEQLSASQLATLCPGGTVTDIQCVDAVTGDDWVSLAEASCSVKDGLSCTNLPFPGVPPCHDYKIRYMCNCTGRFSSHYYQLFELSLLMKNNAIKLSIFKLYTFKDSFLKIRIKKTPEA